MYRRPRSHWETYKICSICKKSIWLVLFKNNKHTADGLNDYCYHCDPWRHYRHKVSSVFSKAVRLGTLTRPIVCEACGDDTSWYKPKREYSPKVYVQGHHCDYGFPLNVMWLCIPCHRKYHSNSHKQEAHRSNILKLYAEKFNDIDVASQPMPV